MKNNAFLYGIDTQSRMKVSKTYEISIPITWVDIIRESEAPKSSKLRISVFPLKIFTTYIAEVLMKNANGRSGCNAKPNNVASVIREDMETIVVPKAIFLLSNKVLLNM